MPQSVSVIHVPAMSPGLVQLRLLARRYCPPLATSSSSIWRSSVAGDAAWRVASDPDNHTVTSPRANAPGLKL